MRFVRLCLVAAMAAYASPASAAAHHVMDSRLPATWLEGLLSGLSHPVIGVDHLAFFVVVGLVSAFVRNGARLGGVFLASLLLGALVSLLKPNVRWVDALVALSVLVAGVALVMQKANSDRIWGVLAIGAGVLHGYALGGPVSGAPSGTLVFYLLGLAGALLLILVPVRTFAELALVEDRAEELKLQATGGAVAALGLFFLANAVT